MTYEVGAEGWHVYAPIDANMGQDKSVTKVTFKLPDGIEAIGSLQLPKDAGSIYTGKGIKMIQKFRVKKGTAKGKLTTVASIHFQCCNEEMCYPPVTEKENITIEVK